MYILARPPQDLRLQVSFDSPIESPAKYPMDRDFKYGNLVGAQDLRSPAVDL